MQLDAFLRWDDGTDTHYELIGGFPLPLPRNLAVQRVLAVRLGSKIEGSLSRRRPCNAQLAPGASDEIYAEVHRRAGQQWITELLRGDEAVLSLSSVPIEIRLSDLYEGIALEAEDC